MRPTGLQAPASRPLVLVTVGSDHHPFNRLVEWMDLYLARATAPPVRYVCQHGPARAPNVGEHRDFVDHEVLLRWLAESTAVVCHGGPATLFECLRSERRPIAVPREAGFGEAVDDHQRSFCEFLAERGLVVLATTKAALHEALEAMLTEGADARLPRTCFDADLAGAVSKFEESVRRCRPSRRGLVLTRRQVRSTGFSAPTQ